MEGEDLISKRKALDALGERPLTWTGGDYELGCRNQYDTDRLAIETVPSVQSKATDTISRQTVRYKLTALVNEFEEILSRIREREVDDSVCGLCEYDGAYVGESGDWCNECPGFDKDDCFKLKDQYRKEWLNIDE